MAGAQTRDGRSADVGRGGKHREREWVQARDRTPREGGEPTPAAPPSSTTLEALSRFTSGFVFNYSHETMHKVMSGQRFGSRLAEERELAGPDQLIFFWNFTRGLLHGPYQR